MSEGTVDNHSAKIIMAIRLLSIFLFVTGFIPVLTFAQDSNSVPSTAFNTDSISKWSFYTEGDYYIFPTNQNIFMLVTMADRKLLHLEVRYNYEDLNTASVFGGINFNFGNEFNLLLTPVAGLVFGHLNGVVPGLETSISYKIVEFNAQSEYLIDFLEKENDFGYTYLQLGAALLKNFEFGIAAQRTRVYKTNLDLQRGLFTSYAFHTLDGTFTWFNPFTDSYFYVTTLSITF